MIDVEAPYEAYDLDFGLYLDLGMDAVWNDLWYIYSGQSVRPVCKN